MNENTSRIVLASASPRRKMLLEQIGLSFEIHASDLSEQVDLSLTPEQVAETLALQKAQVVAAIQSDQIVIGADTVVVDDLGMLGKPQDPAEAYQMLARLSGRVHRVITGLAVIATASPARTLVRHATTDVKFAPLTEQDMRWYIATGEPLDKAGAYGIQGKGAIFIEGIQGCYNNVVGLPVFLLVQMLKELGAFM